MNIYLIMLNAPFFFFLVTHCWSVARLLRVNGYERGARRKGLPLEESNTPLSSSPSHDSWCRDLRHELKWTDRLGWTDRADCEDGSCHTAINNLIAVPRLTDSCPCWRSAPSTSTTSIFSSAFALHFQKRELQGSTDNCPEGQTQ